MRTVTWELFCKKYPSEKIAEGCGEPLASIINIAERKAVAFPQLCPLCNSFIMYKRWTIADGSVHHVQAIHE